jgi:hypothetical protein
MEEIAIESPQLDPALQEAFGDSPSEQHRDENLTGPQVCEYCGAYQTSNCNDKGLFICDLCELQDKYGQDAVVEVLAIQIDMEHTQQRIISHQAAISEWFRLCHRRNALQSPKSSTCKRLAHKLFHR